MGAVQKRPLPLSTSAPRLATSAALLAKADASLWRPCSSTAVERCSLLQVECGIQKLLHEITEKKSQQAATELLVLLVQRGGYSAADLQAGIAVFSAQMEDLRCIRSFPAHAEHAKTGAQGSARRARHCVGRFVRVQ